MGYQITFKPTEEKMEEYNVFSQRTTVWNNLDADYADLLYSVFFPGDSPKNFYLNLQVKISSIMRQELEDCKKFAYSQWKEEGEVYFCGWEFAEGHYSSTKESLLTLFLEEFYKLAYLVPTPDYFDDVEKWYKKYNEIYQQIRELKEESISLGNHIICEELAEFKLKGDDE